MQYTKDKIMATTNSGKPKSIAKRVPLKSVAAAKAKAIQNETARKKIISTSPPAKVKETLRNSNGSVKVVPASPAAENKRFNSFSTALTNNYKSGDFAKATAGFKDQSNEYDVNQGTSKKKVIKINSAKVTPQGTQPALRIRSTGGLGGGGGTLKNVIR